MLCRACCRSRAILTLELPRRLLTVCILTRILCSSSALRELYHSCICTISTFIYDSRSGSRSFHDPVLQSVFSPSHHTPLPALRRSALTLTVSAAAGYPRVCDPGRLTNNILHCIYLFAHTRHQRAPYPDTCFVTSYSNSSEALPYARS